jgi:hypothetical protein
VRRCAEQAAQLRQEIAQFLAGLMGGGTDVDGGDGGGRDHQLVVTASTSDGGGVVASRL